VQEISWKAVALKIETETALQTDLRKISVGVEGGWNWLKMCLLQGFDINDLEHLEFCYRRFWRHFKESIWRLLRNHLFLNGAFCHTDTRLNKCSVRRATNTPGKGP
jgi:hypothetical protein